MWEEADTWEEIEHGSYILWRHGPDGRHDIDDGDKRGPTDGPYVNRQASPSEVKRPPLKLAVTHLTDDGNTIRPIESDGREVEDGSNGRVRPQSDQVDQYTRYGEKPDGVNRRIRPLVDLVPDSRQGQHFIASVSPDRSGTGLNGRHGCEIKNEASGYGKEDASFPPNDIVENLSYGLNDDIIEGMSRITAAVR